MSLYDVANKFGAWQDDQIWSLGAPPTGSQDAFIGGASAVRVTSDDSVTVNSVGVASGDELEFGLGSTLTATNGTVLGADDQGHSYGIDGIVDLVSNSTFSVGDALANFGLVAVDDALIALNGVVSFTGVGTIQLGAETDNRQFSAGGIDGGGLSNFGNTIEGGGIINVASLDNAAGAISAQEANGNWLRINATTFTNEATLEIGEQATMDLGFVNAQSLTNTGTINIGYDEGGANSGAHATLAISGKYTINGSGSINFGGDDASIVSDRTAGSSFINGVASSIHANFTGEIGNGASVANADNLAFTNDGNVFATGAGVTLTIDTAGNTVHDPGGLLEADDNATLVIDSPAQMGQYYAVAIGSSPIPGGTIEATGGGTVEIGSTVANGPPPNVITIRQSSGQILADTGSTVVIKSGGSVAVPIQINGASGGVPGAVVSLASGGAITGALTFEGPGATFNDNSTSAATFTFAGGGGAIKFASSGNTADFGSTGGVWDSVTGSGEAIAEMSALVSIVGGGETITSGSGSIASLYDTKGVWDAVNSSNEEVILTSAQAAIDGGGVAAYANAGSAVSFAGTSGTWDALFGSTDQITLSDAQASILGGGDTIWATNGSSTSLYNTGGSWDAFYGSYDAVILSTAQASVLGGYDTISANAGSSISLYDTGTHADAFTGANDALYLNTAEAVLNGSADTVYFSGSSAVTSNGQYFAFYFGAQLGVSSISGFNTSDVLHLNASDWSSFSALQASGELFASGGNVEIKISTSDVLTLLGANISALSATDVKFG